MVDIKGCVRDGVTALCTLAQDIRKEPIAYTIPVVLDGHIRSYGTVGLKGVARGIALTIAGAVQVVTSPLLAVIGLLVYPVTSELLKHSFFCLGAGLILTLGLGPLLVSQAIVNSFKRPPPPQVNQPGTGG